MTRTWDPKRLKNEYVEMGPKQFSQSNMFRKWNLQIKQHAYFQDVRLNTL